MNRANRPRKARISGSSYDSRAMSRAGDGSTLSLDFTTGVLDPRLTFTRSTTATYINSSGYVTSAAINEARFDYDTSTLALRGLLIEGPATNLTTRSDSFDDTGNLSWLASGMTRTATSATSPKGITETVALIAGNGSFRSNTITVTASTLYTFSFWAKNNSGTQARYRVWNATAGSSIVDYTLPGSNYISSINNTTWTRISVSFTTPVGCTSVFVYPCSSDTAGTNVFLWGAQLEVGAASTSYVTSTASQGTRSQDNAIIAAGAAFSGWYTGGLNGTFYADWYGGVAGASGTQRSVLATDDVTTKHLHLYQTATTNTMTLANFGGGSTIATSNAISPAGARSKSAFSYATSAMNLCLNGGTVASGTVTGFTVAPTWLSLGGPSTNGTAITGTTVMLNNSIRAIKYWPTVLPNTTLQSLTA